MVDSPNSRHGIESRTRTPFPAPTSLSRYDLVLLAVPTAFFLALLASHLLSLTPRTAIIVASLFAALTIGDGLFRHPPTDGRTR